MAIALKDLRVACILDEFSYECFRPECNLIKFGPNDWMDIFTKERPDLLFVESAWQGNDQQWTGRVGYYNEDKEKPLRKLLHWCKQNDIPTVFWNKEDPVHFNRFINHAKYFDYIYTTDENSKIKYQEKVQNTPIDVLPFAAQPKIHNPIRVKNYKNRNICFSGSYYGTQHPERTKDMNVLLDVATKYGLDIYDRNYNVKSTNYRFPPKYKKFIAGNLPYKKLVDVSKEYKVCINVNSVKNSPSMCSRRIFELLSSGIKVVSNSSPAIERWFMNIVSVAEDRKNINTILNKAINNTWWREQKELQGIRKIYDQHTYGHRLYKIAKNCGISVITPYNHKVQVISYANNLEQIDTVYKYFNSQDYTNKTLTVFVGDSFTNSMIKRANKTFACNIIRITDRKGKISDLVDRYDYLTYFDPGNYYGPYFLTDLLIGAIYSNATIVGKGSYFQFYDKTGQIDLMKSRLKYSYTSKVLNVAAIIHHSVIEQCQTRLMDLFNKDIFYRKFRKTAKFSIDPYNFIKNDRLPVPNKMNRHKRIVSI